MLTARQSGFTLNAIPGNLQWLKKLAFILPPALLLLLCLVLQLITPGTGKRFNDFTDKMLIFSGGFISIGCVIVIMFLFQTRFGVLYLYVGLLSAMFMVGLCLGSVLTRRILLDKALRSKQLLFPVMLLHCLLLAWIGWGNISQWDDAYFIVALLLPGICSGAYFPVAADNLRHRGMDSGLAGSSLEMADHLGAAVGAMLTGIILIPLLGTGLIFLVFVIILCLNVLLQIWRMKKKNYLIIILAMIILALLGLGLWHSNRLSSAMADDAAKPDLAQGSDVELSSPGKARKADHKKIRWMIKENKLSDHEAEFYQQLP